MNDMKNKIFKIISFWLWFVVLLRCCWFEFVVHLFTVI